MCSSVGADARAVELIVLDAHGVVFNNPWSMLLARMAKATDREFEEVRQRWVRDLHDDAWLGAVTDEGLWSHLSGDESEAAVSWRETLETMYIPTRACDQLAKWREVAPIWILSNHRSAWLHERLDRFGVAAYFDRVLVSEETQLMKPDPLAFRPVLSHVSHPGAALFVDDQPRNVTAASALGMSVVLADDSALWVDEVDWVLGFAANRVEPHDMLCAAARKDLERS